MLRAKCCSNTLQNSSRLQFKLAQRLALEHLII
uniref:Uncharacterized protein n=1 Tax=Arundo donax TaxID=35708 RepID=A0A0A9S7I2_ARUDO